MNTLNQLKNIFSNIICLHFQDKEGALASDKTETKVDESDKYKNLSPEQKEVLEQINLLKKELDGVDATKKITGKAGSYLSNKLKNDPEALTDPEAKPTIELLQRYKRQFNEALNSSRDITKEIQELKENVAKLADKFVSDNGLLEETAKESEKSKEAEKGLATEKPKEAEKSKLSEEKMKTITNSEFLQLPKEERLQYVTKDSIDYKNVATGDVKNVTFFFDQDGNNRDDSDLYRLTTLGQVMGKEVGEVESGGVIYSRSGINGEFFNGSRRLVIHTDTQVAINKTRTPEELKNIQELIDKGFEKYKDSPDADIVKEALERGIDPEFSLLSFSDTLKGLEGVGRKVKMEEVFTQFDRIKNEISDWDGKISVDGKYPDELVVKTLREFNTDWEDKAGKCGIDSTKIKEVEAKLYARFKDIDISNLPQGVNGLLEFISIAEGTKGNYNAIYGNARQNSIDFGTMTLAEVLDYQKTYKIGKGSAAIGKYQFMDYTLRDMMRKYGINSNEKFTPELQDRLAICKLKEKGLDSYLSGSMENQEFQLNLSREWASLPKDSSGKSYYEGDGLNHALVSSSQIGGVLDNLKKSVS